MNNNREVSVPSAATVILLRDTRIGMEVYLMRRHRAQSFMGGAHVFPGGRVDDSDGSERLKDTILFPGNGSLAELLQEPALSESTARAIFMAAIRETFEEAGILLAGGPGIGALMADDKEMRNTRSRLRTGLHDGNITLEELALETGIMYDPGMLVPYSHWITPEVERKRFDTRFFITAVPEGQEPAHDNLEMTESLWISPEEALARHRRGELLLMPPTLTTVSELTDFLDVSAAVSFARRRTIAPILPQAFMHEKGFGVLLPHDPAYEIVGFKQPPRPGEISRVVMEDGVWKTASA